MIDVSKLPRIQQSVALLVERSGLNGLRPKELLNEAGGSKSRIKEALSKLTKSKTPVKNTGDVPRYYSPETVPATALAHNPHCYCFIFYKRL